MPIPVTCRSCGANYTLPDDKAGKTGRCRCGATIAVPAAGAPPAPMPAAAPPPPPPPVPAPAPLPSVEDVTVSEDEWALDYGAESVTAVPTSATTGPKSVTEDPDSVPMPAIGAPSPGPAASTADAAPLEPMNLGARPNIQRVSHLDKASIGYGIAAFFVLAMMFFVMGGIAGEESGGGAILIGVLLLLVGLIVAIAGGKLQIVVSALPGQPGGAVTITRRMVWFPYYQRRFRISGGGRLTRKEEASNVHVDAIFIVIILALLAAGGIPGLLFFAAWSEARNGSVVSLSFEPEGGGAPVKLYSATMAAGRPYPRQLTELEGMLKRVMPLRRS